MRINTKIVTPVKTGVQKTNWIPAFAGMTALALCILSWPGKAFAGVTVSSPTIAAVYVSSMDLTWVSTPAASGYVIEVATRTPIPPPQITVAITGSVASSFTVTGLQPNTTYFARIGGVSSGTTHYANTTATSKVTLASLVSGSFLSQVSSTSLLVQWTSLTNSTSTIGYLAMASTAANFTGTVSSFTTVGYTGSAALLSNLIPSTSYYVRVGALNWGGIPNYVLIGSTRTTTPGAGTAPILPYISGVDGSTVTVGWGEVGSNNGYVVEASTFNGYTGSIISTSTLGGSSTTLTVQGLSFNTTYYFRAGAVWSGTTYYAAALPPSIVTLSTSVANGRFYFVGVTTMTVDWTPLGAGESEAYVLEASTSSSFTTIQASSMTTLMSLSTLTVSGLVPATTYFMRIVTFNSEGLPVYTTLGSTVTYTATIPTGLVGVAQSVSSLQWNWNLVPGATGYTLYIASSPTTAVATVAAPPYTENSLSTNVGYGRVVAAWSSGVASALSASATAYTFTNLPGVANVSAVGASSFTVSWTTANPSYTPYQVELALDSGFTVGVTTPVPFSALLLSNTTNVTGLTASTNYWVRIRSVNGDGVQSNGGPSTSLTTTSGSGGGSGVGGQGTVSISPSSVPEGGQIASITLSFVVPSGGFTSGGGVKVQTPFGWWPTPQTNSSASNGYVSVLSIPSRTFTVTTSTDGSVQALLSNGQTLSAGTTIQVTLENMYANCPAPNQTAVAWSVSSKDSAAATFSPLSSQPTQTFASSGAKWLAFSPWTNLSAVTNQPSTAVTLEGRSYCGNPAAVTSTLPIQLSGYLSDYVTADSGAQFASNSGFSTIITSVTLTAGTTQAVFYYKTSGSGNNLSIRASYNDIQNGYATYIMRQVNVLASAISFAGLSLDNGVQGSAQASFTVTPDNDGSNDFVYIRFTPSDATAMWHVAISSDGFNSMVYERYGYGDPQGTVQWDGRNQYGGMAGNSIVPNGTYQVKVEIPGLTPVTSLSITVLGASISGRLTLGGSGISNAWINAQATSGFGYGGAMTDGSGYFTINGLKSGQIYNLNTYFYDPTTQTPFSGSRTSITAPATGADITFSQPAQLRVAATLSQSALNNYFGSVSAQDSGYTNYYSGNIQIAQSATTSTNGDYFNPSTWTVLVVQPGSYVVRLQMPGFQPQSQNVTVVAGQTLDVPLFSLTLPSAVYGKITLPSAVSQGTWISVDGVKSGNTYPTVWGGAYFNVGESTGIYSVYNVNPGAYTFRVRVPGFAMVTLSTTVASVIGDSINGGLDISSASFGLGGRISGTITVNGDSSALGPLTLWVNAYSPSLGSGEFAQVTLATDTATTNAAYQINGLTDGTYQVYPPYLNGFELVPPGPKSVTVSGGVGALNMTLQQNTGQITGSITLPGSNSDYSNVTLSAFGPMSSTTTVASGSTYMLPNLGSGFYTVTAFYQTTGAQVRQSLAVVNGQASTLNLALNSATYAVTGTVTMGSAITLSLSGGGSATLNTMTDLLANEAYQYLYLGGGSIQVSTARVEAFPKRFDSFGNANRTGFGNTFAFSDFKYGLIQADGSYSISGLTPGVWEINVYPYLDAGTTPSLAVTKQTVTITTASASGIDFALSSGFTVEGTVSLPSGLTDNRYFDVRILTDRGDYVQSTQLSLGAAGSPSNSITYLFKNLSSGHYVLTVQDPGTWDTTLQRMVRKYVSKPIAFEVAGADLSNLDVTMAKSSRILGKLSILGTAADGSLTSNLITSNNLTLLPDNLRIAAQATPWVEGGYSEAERDYVNAGGRLDLNADNQFHIEGLVPGTYDVQFRQDSYGASILGQGSVNLAALTKGQIRVLEGQAVDLGTIELKQGLTLTGTVKDDQGNALPNIRVRAEASGRHENFNNSETYTDAAGQYSLTGLNPDLKNYSITAAPRPYPGEFLPPSPYGQVVKRSVDVTQVPLPAVNFVLTAANASLSGTVITADGGALSYPEDKQQGFPSAAIYLQRQGVATSSDDPLGEIREATALGGTFSISSLVPGTYQVLIVSLNYKPRKFTMTINAGSNDVGTVTLQSGSVLTATLAKPDGSGVNTQDVQFAVAVTADLGSIIFGQITSDDNTRAIRSIRFSGFETSKSYSVLLFDKSDNITSPIEGKGLSFTTDTEDRTVALTYQPSAPTAYAQVKKVGSAAEVSFFFSRSLRNTQPSDDVASGLISIVSGAGAISEAVISGDRKSMSFTYTPPADELSARLQFSAYTADVDPATGSEFAITKTITLRFGHKAAAEKNINPIFGGEVSLAEVGNDASRLSLPSNALRTTTGDAADADTTYAVEFTATDDPEAGAAAAPVAHGVSSRASSRARAMGAQMARGSGAYLGEAFEAMSAARANAAVNPLSSFYSVLLPAGLSHSLNATAILTLQYDTNADPALINVYYFNGVNYLLENANRTIDTVNHTITVGVSHFSTFVVLQNDAQVIVVDGDATAAGALEVMNFPNPFDLTAKTKTLNHGGTTTSLTTNGTIIRYEIPSARAGAASIDIYNVVGEKVRGIDLGVPTAATYHYVAWDGKNDSGNNVASGVYIGVLKVGGSKKIWKMAVIK